MNYYKIPKDIKDNLYKTLIHNEIKWKFYFPLNLNWGFRFKYYIEELEWKNLKSNKKIYQNEKRLENIKIEYKEEYEKCFEIINNGSDYDTINCISKQNIREKVGDSSYGFENLNLEVRFHTDDEGEKYKDEYNCAMCPCCSNDIQKPAYEKIEDEYVYEEWNNVEDLLSMRSCECKNCPKKYNEKLEEEEWRCEECWNEFFPNWDEIENDSWYRIEYKKCLSHNKCLHCSHLERDEDGSLKEIFYEGLIEEDDY